MKLILASNNKNKLREFSEILSGSGIDVISQSDAGLCLDVEETGTTFEENAFLKAEAACKASGRAAVADDSGLVVEALGGEPGVYSARYGGGNLTDSEKCSLILEKLEGKENRNAKFVSAIVCVLPGGDILKAVGECYGTIADKAYGSGGFGYDPIFYVKKFGKTMGEMTAEEKNSVSHRGSSLRKFKEEFDKYLTKEK